MVHKSHGENDAEAHMEECCDKIIRIVRYSEELCVLMVGCGFEWNQTI
jgi:hypothetical protein